MSESSLASLSAHGLETFLHEKIPLSQAMGVRVTESSPRQLVLEAPLAPNRNHLGTAFGGSLHTLPTLACYGALWTALRDAGIEGHVVLKRSTTHYRRPVTDVLRAVCPRPPGDRLSRFLADLRRYRKARLELHASVEGAHGSPAVEYAGTFVAFTDAQLPEPDTPAFPPSPG